MLLTTTSDLPNMHVTRFFGVVSATTFIGGDDREVFNDAIAAAADGVIAPLERLEQEARRAAIDLLRFKASELNADAIIGLQIDHRTIDEKNNLVMIFAAGTAVQTNVRSVPRQGPQTVGNPGW